MPTRETARYIVRLFQLGPTEFKVLLTPKSPMGTHRHFSYTTLDAATRAFYLYG